MCWRDSFLLSLVGLYGPHASPGHCGLVCLPRVHLLSLASGCPLQSVSLNCFAACLPTSPFNRAMFICNSLPLVLPSGLALARRPHSNIRRSSFKRQFAIRARRPDHPDHSDSLGCSVVALGCRRFSWSLISLSWLLVCLSFCLVSGSGSCACCQYLCLFVLLPLSYLSLSCLCLGVFSVPCPPASLISLSVLGPLRLLFACCCCVFRFQRGIANLHGKMFLLFFSCTRASGFRNNIVKRVGLHVRGLLWLCVCLVRFGVLGLVCCGPRLLVLLVLSLLWLFLFAFMRALHFNDRRLQHWR